jgi:hypothetical protein
MKEIRKDVLRKHAFIYSGNRLKNAYRIINYVTLPDKSRDSSVVYRWATGWMIGRSSPGKG